MFSTEEFRVKEDSLRYARSFASHAEQSAHTLAATKIHRRNLMLKQECFEWVKLRPKIAGKRVFLQLQRASAASRRSLGAAC